MALRIQVTNDTDAIAGSGVCMLMAIVVVVVVVGVGACVCVVGASSATTSVPRTAAVIAPSSSFNRVNSNNLRMSYTV